ncbi:LysR family transcriptional regulator ArgP [Rhodococcoides corynebacterioides]|uniref:LysR family transcriptional regulator ArgP n=1 Tax=Rhodococcoides corynebacterioides TaxID=53972 RepID=UPI001C9B2108|nr:LysR family transcriptional regulator ArgP [Rhodococcus corynebacterioides]MBY6348893.1 LysR family transcriptional regulator ArgP [Rhodococcus corynebacterioides]
MQSEQLEALRAAVDLGSFDAAARALHVTPSAISQRIRALEQDVGSVLVVRSRPVRATDSGSVMLRLARQIRTLTDAALQDVRPAGGTTRVSIAVNADSLATWIVPALAPLAGTVLLDLHREDENRTADLLRDGTVTAAVTADDRAVRGCSVVSLGALRYRPCAAPTAMARWFADGVDAVSLRRAHTVVFDEEDALQDRWLARRGVDPTDVLRHRVPSSAEFTGAVAAGLGWGMVPDPQRGDHPLVELDDSVLDVPLFWQQWTLSSPALDAVGAAVRDAAGRTLVPVSASVRADRGRGPSARP